MKKLITLSAFAAALVCLFSCETYKVKDPEMTAINKVDGKYMAFAYKDGAAEPTTMFAIVITNTTNDDADAGWITITDMDYTGLHWQRLFAVRFKMTVDANAQTFVASNSSVIEPKTAWNPYIEGAYGSYGSFTTASAQWGNFGCTTASINGKVVTEGVTTPSGHKADSIEFTYTLNYDDGTSESYTVKGQKKTGWGEDAIEYEEWLAEKGW
ncbi:MAG: hypothetical protein IKP02_06970 [Paludibacteraceae bacterium]|nr:hypothetical protein [Prevotella sp.]MBR4705321.1 hypothetical protein [Paludibacteraceae bacterium]